MNKLIDKKYTDWIARNLLFNYGLWDDSHLFKESFYINNNLNLNIDISEFSMMIFGVSKKYSKNSNREDIHYNMEHYFKSMCRLEEYANSLGFSMDSMLIKVDNSKQVLLLLSKNIEASISYEECAHKILTKAKDIYINNIESLKYFSCSFTEGYHGYEDMNRAYTLARYLNDLIFFIPKCEMITSKWVDRQTHPFETNYFLSSYSKWLNILYYGSIEDTVKYTKSLFKKIKETYDFKYFTYVYYNMLDALDIMIAANEIKIDDIKAAEFFSIDQYEAHIVNIIKRTINSINRRISINSTQAVYYINKNYYKKDLSIPEVADFIGVHSAYLSSEFKKEMNVSMVQYIHYYRIQKSMNLLVEQDDNIQEIAHNVGYINEEYFRKYFKKYNEMTPNEYRHLKKGV